MSDSIRQVLPSNPIPITQPRKDSVDRYKLQLNQGLVQVQPKKQVQCSTATLTKQLNNYQAYFNYLPNDN